MSNVQEYMVGELNEALEEANRLGAAIWGGMANIKGQQALDNRKATLSGNLEKIIRYLRQLQKDVESLKMVDLNQKDQESD